jgi:hypothetical protein
MKKLLILFIILSFFTSIVFTADSSIIKDLAIEWLDKLSPQEALKQMILQCDGGDQHSKACAWWLIEDGGNGEACFVDKSSLPILMHAILENNFHADTIVKNISCKGSSNCRCQGFKAFCQWQVDLMMQLWEWINLVDTEEPDEPPKIRFEDIERLFEIIISSKAFQNDVIAFQQRELILICIFACMEHPCFSEWANQPIKSHPQRFSVLPATFKRFCREEGLNNKLRIVLILTYLIQKSNLNNLSPICLKKHFTYPGSHNQRKLFKNEETSKIIALTIISLDCPKECSCGCYVTAHQMYRLAAKIDRMYDLELASIQDTMKNLSIQIGTLRS